MRKTRGASIWPSYVDLMTNLFAITLVLFVVSYALFKKKEAELTQKIGEIKVMAKEYEKLKEIYKAVENIDRSYFSYSVQYKKYILNIDVNFPTEKYKITDLITSREETIEKLDHAGDAILKSIEQFNEEFETTNVKYLIVIEGQSSADSYHIDDYKNNDVLSYMRALALKNYWQDKHFERINNCELIVAGSGEGGVPRYTSSNDETLNQRFLVHVVPVLNLN